MNYELIETARRLSREEDLPEEVAETLNLLASAYRDRCISLERLTNAIGDMYEHERTKREYESQFGV